MNETKQLNLNDSVAQNTIALIWVTKAPLSTELEYFHQANYLLNGLLVKNTSRLDVTKNNISFFMAESFDHPFFLAHIKSDESHLYNDISPLIDIVTPHIYPNAEVAIIGESITIPKDLIGKLQKKHPELSFKGLV